MEQNERKLTTSEILKLVIAGKGTKESMAVGVTVEESDGIKLAWYDIGLQYDLTVGQVKQLRDLAAIMSAERKNNEQTKS